MLFDRPLATRGIFIPQSPVNPDDISKFETYFGEHLTIALLMEELGISPENSTFVDIGAGDGVDHSNTYLLAAAGARGISVDFDSDKFAMLAVTYRTFPNVRIAKAPATPEDVCALLSGMGAAPKSDLLNLDIDSFDYWVLKALLEQFDFNILCLEINPLFPINVDFSVGYPNPEWSEDWFAGMSLSLAWDLLQTFGYSTIRVDRGCLFAVKDSAALLSFEPLSKADAGAALDLSLVGTTFSFILDEYRNRDEGELLKSFHALFGRNPDTFILRSSEG